MSGFEIEIVVLLLTAATLAGFIDAIAGGGGLITIPALLLAGLDPVAAVATNKSQAVFGAGSATYAFARAGRIDWRAALPMAAMAGIGGLCGALAISLVPVDLLRGAIPIMLIVMALYFALSPKIRDEDAKARMPALAFTLTFVPVIGFYDGIFGPGTGSFFMLGFVTLLGFGVLRATAHTKLLNLASNAGGLLLLGLAGKVVWPIGLAMALFQIAGAQLGSHLAIRHGARIIRPLLVAVCCAMAMRLLWDETGPLRLWLAAW